MSRSRKIDENLCRAELTPAQRAAAISRRKQIWEALHPEGGNTVSTLGGKQQVGFAADTCAAAGLTKQAINQHLSRASTLGEDLKAVAGTSLDRGGVELDALKALPAPDRYDRCIVASRIRDTGDALDLLRGIRSNGGEGLMAYRADQPYYQGRMGDLLKLTAKVVALQEAANDSPVFLQGHRSMD